MNILVVDDNPEVRKAVVRYLSVSNPTYQFIMANDGIEGLKKLEEEETKVDVIVSDISMGGMGGVEFADNLEKLYPELVSRLIFFSGETNPKINLERYKFVQKPDLKLLETEIKKYENVSTD